MRDTISAAAEKYGQTLTVVVRGETAPRQIRGFVQSLEPDRPEKGRAPSPLGVVNQARRRLIAPASAFSGKEKDVYIGLEGRLYRMLRREKIGSGEAAHWECILRESGVRSDA